MSGSIAKASQSQAPEIVTAAQARHLGGFGLRKGLICPAMRAPLSLDCDHQTLDNPVRTR